MSKLRDNGQLFGDVLAIVRHGYSASDTANFVLDAIDRHLATAPAHPGHLQGEARDASPLKPGGKTGTGAKTISAPTPTTTVIEPTPGPSHRPGGPPSPPPEPASMCTCFHAPEQHDANGCRVDSFTTGPCSCKYDGRRPASPGGSGGGGAK